LGTSAAGRIVSGSEPIDDRFVVDTASESSTGWRDDVTVVRELQELDIAIVVGKESSLSGLRFTKDFEVEVSPPESYTPENPPSTDDDHGAPGSASPFQWDKASQRTEAVHEQGILGDGATISIIDNGVDPTHPDISPLYDESGSNTYESDEVTDGDHIGGADHGTHVAGIAAGAGEAFVLGSAPRARIISQNVFFPEGGASFANILSGIYDSIEQEANVMNLSLGAYPVPATVDRKLIIDLHVRAAELAYDQGSLIVASAGNDAANLDTDGDVLSLPNEVPGFMSISATGPIGFSPDDDATNPNAEDGELDAEPHLPAFYTTYGADEVDVSAPGGNAGGSFIGGWFYDLVYSAVPGSAGWKAGTSMAAPQVTGVAALVASENPDATPAQIRQHIRNTASQIDVEYEISSWPQYFGSEDLLVDPYDSQTYRGQGHLDTVRAATKQIRFPSGVTVQGETVFPADPDDDGLYEDVNGDGVVDMEDAELLYQMALRGIGGLEADQAFDFDGDGSFDMVDVQTFIREYVE